MSKGKNSKKTKKSSIGLKIGVGAGGAALLGLAMGSNAQSQERSVFTARPAQRVTAVDNLTVSPAATITADDFIRNFKYTMNDKEMDAWRSPKVQAAYAYTSRLPLSEQVEFVENPDGYVREHNYTGMFGIEPGSVDENGIQSVEVGALVKNVRLNIMNTLLKINQKAHYCWS